MGSNNMSLEVESNPSQSSFSAAYKGFQFKLLAEIFHAIIATILIIKACYSAKTNGHFLTPECVPLQLYSCGF